MSVGSRQAVLPACGLAGVAGSPEAELPWEAPLSVRESRHNAAYQTAGTLPSAEPRGSQSTCFSTSNPWWPDNSVTGKRAREETQAWRKKH